MAVYPAKPTTPEAKKKRQRQMLIAGGALALLLLFYLRSRSSGSTDAAQAAADAANQAAVAQQAQQQTAPAGSSVTPSTFADNGAQAAALGDAVTTGLSGVQAALQDLAASEAQLAQSGSTTGQTPSLIGSINVGQPAGGKHKPKHPKPKQHPTQHHPKPKPKPHPKHPKPKLRPRTPNAHRGH